MASASQANLESAVRDLKLSSASTKSSHKVEVADSWEDEADAGSEGDSEIRSQTPPPARTGSTLPAPPPPTPASPLSPAWGPTHGYEDIGGRLSAFDGGSSSTRAAGADEKRQEKTTAVAARLIAAGIGQKAPRRTQEQREYDQAMKVQEKKCRDRAREEEERKRKEKEQALKDVWGD